MRIKKNRLGFSLLELMLAMTIFVVVGFSLYGMFDVLTSLQSTSLGVQHFKNDAYLILDQMEKQISAAVTGNFHVFQTGVGIQTQGSTPTLKVSVNPVFLCYTPTGADPLYRTESKSNMPNLYFSNLEFTKPESGDIAVLELEEMIKRSTYLRSSCLVEHTILLNSVGEIMMDTNREAVSDGEINYYDGTIHAVYFVPPKRIGRNVEEIQYLFWKAGMSDWNNGGAPVKTWDSQTEGGLPEAMKIVLTMNYDPEDSPGIKTAGKNRRFVFERVIAFKHE